MQTQPMQRNTRFTTSRRWALGLLLAVLVAPGKSIRRRIGWQRCRCWRAGSRRG